MILISPSISITSASAVQNSFSRPLLDQVSPLASRNVDGTSTLDQRSQDVIQKIVKGRKSWKTLRGDTEAVWPPPLEAALIQGLENYRPGDSRETRLLGRFPMRNKFISEHIFRVTGKRRTAKQVGSRLQQLRDTCGGHRSASKHLSLAHDGHRLASCCPSHPLHMSQQPEPDIDLQWVHRHFRLSNSTVTSSNTPLPSQNSASRMPGTPFSERDTLFCLPHPTTLVSIDILPKWYPAGYDLVIDSPPMSTLQIMDDTNTSDNKIFRPSPHPRSLWAIDPSVTFISSSIISTHSSFTVFEDDRLVHTEVTQMTFLSTGHNNSLLYRTLMVPGFWKKICESDDPTRFTIVQEILPNSSLEMPRSSRTIHGAEPPVLFSATYRFNYPDGMLSEPPSASDPPPPLSPEHTSGTRNSHIHSHSHFLTPYDLSDDEIVSWSEEPSHAAEYESYFDTTDPAEVNIRQSFDCLQNSPDTVTSSVPPSPEQCQRSQFIPVSPSSACFPTDLCNYICN